MGNILKWIQLVKALTVLMKVWGLVVKVLYHNYKVSTQESGGAVCSFHTALIHLAVKELRQ